LNEAAQAWINLANQNNGHDNVSIVLLDCHVSTPLPDLAFPDTRPSLNSEWAESSRGLLQQDETAERLRSEEENHKKTTHKLLWIGIILAALLVGSGIVIWTQVHSGSQPRQEQLRPNP
jgi:protein phosphatase